MTIPLLSHIKYLPAFAIIVYVLCSCNGTDKFLTDDYINQNAFIENIKTKINPVNISDSLWSKRLISDIDQNISYTYHLVNFKPLWFNANNLKNAALLLPVQINALWDEGLNPGKYLTGELQRIISKLSAVDKIGALPIDSLVKWDIQFTRSYLEASKDLLLGLNNLQKVDSNWKCSNDTLFDGAKYLANNLKNSDEFPSFDAFRPDIELYTLMRIATKELQLLVKDTVYLSLKNRINENYSDDLAIEIIKKEISSSFYPQANDNIEQWISTYQYFHHLKETGKPDSATQAQLKQNPQELVKKLKINQERLRALPRKLGSEVIWINIPLMEITYSKNKEVIYHEKARIGKENSPTFSLNAYIETIVFNPIWCVIPDILKNNHDKHLNNSEIKRLEKKGVKAYDSNGKKVTHLVNNENYMQFTYSQSSKLKNILGDIHFHISNNSNVHLHSTTDKNTCSHSKRSVNSRCIGIENADILAKLLLEDKHYTKAKIDSLIHSGKTKFQNTTSKTPVYIVYLTVAPDTLGRSMRYLNDIYQIDLKIEKLLHL